ncbi:MAG: hypothetical protein HQM10_08105 [Candidatus Riflebacteria bacterium]|nr:hypothetical protein [Candidatus Riflebacteria bacterium]
MNWKIRLILLAVLFLTNVFTSFGEFAQLSCDVEFKILKPHYELETGLTPTQILLQHKKFGIHRKLNAVTIEIVKVNVSEDVQNAQGAPYRWLQRNSKQMFLSVIMTKYERVKFTENLQAYPSVIFKGRLFIREQNFYGSTECKGSLSKIF